MFDTDKVYRCVKGNGTFDEGEVVYLDKRDGSLVGRDGWLDSSDIEDAVKDAVFEVDNRFVLLYPGNRPIVINKKRLFFWI